MDNRTDLHQLTVIELLLQRMMCVIDKCMSDTREMKHETKSFREMSQTFKKIDNGLDHRNDDEVAMGVDEPTSLANKDVMGAEITEAVDNVGFVDVKAVEVLDNVEDVLFDVEAKLSISEEDEGKPDEWAQHGPHFTGVGPHLTGVEDNIDMCCGNEVAIPCFHATIADVHLGTDKDQITMTYRADLHSVLEPNTAALSDEFGTMKSWSGFPIFDSGICVVRDGLLCQVYKLQSGDYYGGISLPQGICMGFIQEGQGWSRFHVFDPGKFSAMAGLRQGAALIRDYDGFNGPGNLEVKVCLRGE